MRKKILRFKIDNNRKKGLDFPLKMLYICTPKIFSMKLSQFKFFLPQELVAIHPSEDRGDSRLMVLNREKQTIEHKLFKDLLDYFDEGDLFVTNNTNKFATD